MMKFSILAVVLLACSLFEFASGAALSRSCRPRNCFLGLKCGKSSYNCVDGDTCGGGFNFDGSGLAVGDRQCIRDAEGDVIDCLSTSGKVASCTLTCSNDASCPPPPSPKTSSGSKLVKSDACKET